MSERTGRRQRPDGERARACAVANGVSRSTSLWPSGRDVTASLRSQLPSREPPLACRAGKRER